VAQGITRIAPAVLAGSIAAGFLVGLPFGIPYVGAVAGFDIGAAASPFAIFGWAAWQGYRKARNAGIRYE
jgi:hypothetical protein